MDPSVAGSRVRLALLRGFEIQRGGQVVDLPNGAQRLVALLALSRRRLLRTYVAGVLWADYSQDAASANLRTTLWRLRRLNLPIVDATASHLALASEVTVDVHEVSDLAEEIAAGRTDVRRAELSALLDAGQLLIDWYYDWVVVEQEGFRQRRLHALEAMCDTLTEQGRYGLAVQAGLSAIAEEPLRESTHRAVMRAHIAEGNRGEALRQYEMCRQMLVRHLGVEPTHETKQLCELTVSAQSPVMLSC